MPQNAVSLSAIRVGPDAVGAWIQHGQHLDCVYAILPDTELLPDGRREIRMEQLAESAFAISADQETIHLAHIGLIEIHYESGPMTPATSHACECEVQIATKKVHWNF